MNSKENIFSSLVGSKVAESIPSSNIVQNELAKHVLPPIPFLPVRNQNEIKKINSNEVELLRWRKDSSPKEDQQFFPLSFSFSKNGDYWLLPYETMITINGGHTIVKRNVAKKKRPIKGAIKERWAQNDYEITITGALFGEYEIGSVEECYPIRDFEILRDYLTKQPQIWVLCEPLALLGISKIVVEEFSFPFTKGENVQSYEIKAVSDFDFTLLLKLKETGK